MTARSTRWVVLWAALAALGLWLGSACGTSSNSGFGGSPPGSTTGDGPGAGGDPADGDASLGGKKPDAGADGGGSAVPPPDCDRTCDAAGGSCVNKVCVLTEGAAAVDTATKTKLATGGAADATFKFLYPYDRTVFPRGLLPPTLQFDGAAVEACYVHISAAALDYKGYFGPSSPGRAVVSEKAWAAITLGTKAGEALKVEVTKVSGGQASGPIVETWGVAPGSLRGSIYYETYDSQIIGGLASVGVMRIQPGASKPTPLVTGCGNTCHTASADGSTMVAATGLMGLASASYDLNNNAKLRKSVANQAFVYGGLYPDGSLVMSAAKYRTWLGAASRLYDTKTGANVPAAGWDSAVTNASMPSFSPDGTKLVWNRQDTGGGHSLAMANFDVAQKRFSSITDIYRDATIYPAWPVFLPDTKTVVFHSSSTSTFETDADATADLLAIDVATQKVTRLDALDGYGANGTSYLPANDPALNFAPTVLPEAVGGYFWVVFTSHRSYGNTLASKDHNDTYGKLWVAAVDINAAPGTDPSHPAFFLDGQELNADNLRGFWVFDPCKVNGTDCRTGDECCDGYCRPANASNAQCVPPPGGCAQEYEKCKVAADCCDSNYACINAHCAAPPPK